MVYLLAVGVKKVSYPGAELDPDHKNIGYRQSEIASNRDVVPVYDSLIDPQMYGKSQGYPRRNNSGGNWNGDTGCGSRSDLSYRCLATSSATLAGRGCIGNYIILGLSLLNSLMIIMRTISIWLVILGLIIQYIINS